MITVSNYFMGRDVTYREELTELLEKYALETVRRVNALLDAMAKDGIAAEIDPDTGSPVSSGWRPAAINAATPRAARRSRHMLCLACDLYDPDGALDDWCMDHPAMLAEIGLWMEHPSATKNWCHVQTVAPRSGKRVFYP